MIPHLYKCSTGARLGVGTYWNVAVIRETGLADGDGVFRLPEFTHATLHIMLTVYCLLVFRLRQDGRSQGQRLHPLEQTAKPSFSHDIIMSAY